MLLTPKQQASCISSMEKDRLVPIMGPWENKAGNKVSINLSNIEQLFPLFIERVLVAKQFLQDVSMCSLRIADLPIVVLDVANEVELLCDTVHIEQCEYVDLFSKFIEYIPLRACRYHTVCICLTYKDISIITPHDIPLMVLPRLDDAYHVDRAIFAITKVTYPRCKHYALSRCSHAIFKGSNDDIKVVDEENKHVYTIPKETLQKLGDSDLYLWEKTTDFLEDYVYTSLRTSYPLVCTYRENYLNVRNGMAGLRYCLATDSDYDDYDDCEDDLC